MDLEAGDLWGQFIADADAVLTRFTRDGRRKNREKTTLAEMNSLRRNLDEKLPSRPTTAKFREVYVRHAWAEFEERFGSRQDFQLWRWVLGLGEKAGIASTTLSCESAIALFHSGLTHRSALIRWGAALIYAAHISGTDQRKDSGFSYDSRPWLILNANIYRLLRGHNQFPALSGCEAECESIRIACLSACQEMMFETRRKVTASVAFQLRHMQAIEQSIRRRQINWNYRTALESPTKLYGSHQRRLSPHKPIRFIFPLCNALYRAGQQHSPIQHASDQRLGLLLESRFRFAYAAWINWRGERIAEQRRLADPSINPAARSEIDLLYRQAKECEIKSLEGLSMVAEWAGKPYVSSKAAHLLLLQVTQSDKKSQEKWSRIPGRVGYSIRKIGLSMPALSAREKETTESVSPARTAQTVGHPISPPSRVEVALGRGPASWLTVAAFKRPAQWPQVRELDPGQPWDDHPGEVLHDLISRVCNSAGETSQDDVEALVDFALAGGNLVLAMRLVKHRPSLRSLRTVGAELRKIHHYAPLALNQRTHRRWLDDYRIAYRAMSADAQHELALEMHETLSGRGLTILARNPRMADAVAAEWFAGFEEQSGTDAILGVETPRMRDFGSGLAALRDRSRRNWRPVFVTIALLNQDVLSVVVASAATQYTSWTVPLDATVVAMVDHSRRYVHHWRRMGVPIHPGLKTLCKGIQDAVASADSETTCILLTAPPELASLPWQKIFLQLYGSRAKIISIVPSCEWLDHVALSLRARSPQHASILLDESDVFLEKLRQLVRSFEAVEASAGTCVVVGHGVPDGPIPTVCAPHPLAVHEWRQAARADIAVIHACWSGSVSTTAAALGDFGHLPALLLAFGSRLVCAPVLEIAADTAELLQSYINESAASGRREPFAAVYQRAFTENPDIAFYGLYGIPNMTLGETSRVNNRGL